MQSSNSAGVEGPLKGIGSSKILDALSWYLRLIWKHSDTKLNKKKKNCRTKFRGGARLLRPPLDPPLRGVLLKEMGMEGKVGEGRRRRGRGHRLRSL